MTQASAKRPLLAKSALSLAVETVAALEQAVSFDPLSVTPEEWSTRWAGQLLHSEGDVGGHGLANTIKAGTMFMVIGHTEGAIRIPGYVVYRDVTSGEKKYINLTYAAGTKFTFIPGRKYTEQKLTAEQIAYRLRNSKITGSMGSDPEIFAVDKDGKLIPSFEFLGAKPISTQYGEDQHNASAVYWDGYQAEFSHRSFNCINYGTDFIRSGLHNLYNALQKVHPGANLSLRSTFEIPPERLEKDHPQYVQFGCMPSKSAYDEPFKTFDPYIIPFRTAGGHMHLGYNGNLPAAVKALDRILGVISVSLFRYWENPQRRLLYGRAGEYRKTSYGLEYRVLSNAWLCHPMMVHMMFELARRALGAGLAGDWAQWEATEEETRRCINDSDIKLAEEILTRNDIALTGLLASMPGCGLSGTDGTPTAETLVLKDMVTRGVHHYLKQPDFPSSAWGLGKKALPADGTLGKGDLITYRLYSNGPTGRLLNGLQYVVNNKMLD